MATSNPLAALVDNYIHEPTQVHDGGVDLTVSVVYRVTEPGALDFGRDELADADLEPVQSTAREPGDTYEWWTLEEGQYVVQYNEFLGEGADSRLFLQPRNELLARGATHPSVWVDSHLPLLPLSVPTGGVEIKENARVSTLVPIETQSVPDGGE